MAKTTAPLLSFDARGQIGKSQVYSNWRGIPTVRRHTVPANPRTAGQTQTRTAFSWVNAVYKLLDPSVQAVWDAFAKGKPLFGRNAFQKFNLPAVRGMTGSPPGDISDFVGSPGNGGGAAPADVVLSDGGTHHITVTMTAPAIPGDWAIVEGRAVALKQQDAESDVEYTSYVAFDASAPYAPSIATPAAGTYVVAAWFKYTKPDGSTAYGPSTTGTVTLA